MAKESSDNSAIDEQIAALISSMRDGTPAGTIFAELTERSLAMPQSLASITSNLGLTALDLLEEPSPPFTWGDFINLEFTGQLLDTHTQVTTLRHETAGGGSTDPKVISGIMPRVFDLARKSLVGSIAELAKGDEGKELDDISPKSADPDFETARAYLVGEHGEEHRAVLRALLHSNTIVLNAQTALAQDYQHALLGQATSRFPEARREPGNTLRSKIALTNHLRPLLLPPAERVGTHNGLTRHQVGTFIKNMTRP